MTERKSLFSKAAMHVRQGCLAVSISPELSDEAMLEIQADILEKVSQSGVKGVGFGFLPRHIK